VSKLDYRARSLSAQKHQQVQKNVERQRVAYADEWKCQEKEVNMERAPNLAIVPRLEQPEFF
jgi:hypothetical protein